MEVGGAERGGGRGGGVVRSGNCPFPYNTAKPKVTLEVMLSKIR